MKTMIAVLSIGLMAVGTVTAEPSGNLCKQKATLPERAACYVGVGARKTTESAEKIGKTVITDTKQWWDNNKDEVQIKARDLLHRTEDARKDGAKMLKDSFNALKDGWRR